MMVAIRLRIGIQSAFSEFDQHPPQHTDRTATACPRARTPEAFSPPRLLSGWDVAAWRGASYPAAARAPPQERAMTEIAGGGEHAGGADGLGDVQVRDQLVASGRIASQALIVAADADCVAAGMKRLRCRCCERGSLDPGWSASCGPRTDASAITGATDATIATAGEDRRVFRRHRRRPLR
jgi:hypothetical protein